MATVSLQAAYDQARRLLESGDTDHAVGVTQHILGTFPRNLEALRLLGEAYLAGRHLEQAQSAFQTTLASDPENIPAYVGLGITYERQGDLEQAIQSFEKALEIKPDMPELRSQLLRLYTETWGSEGAQLRLSRAGLARLYAKGHMLPQAIQEFRSVIEDQPDRLDARVALAEVLWRDGQEDAAIATCEEILQDFPYALKPNLLLGYLNLATGDPQGEEYWNRALELDPYQTVARAMFDQLPYPTPSQPMLPEWDEEQWQQEQDAQHRAAQEQRPPEQQTFVEPVAAATGAAAAASSDDDFFGGSWMDTIDDVPEGQPVAAADDDFLARLLAFDGADAEAGVVEDVAADEERAPFSVDEIAPFSFEEEVSGLEPTAVPEMAPANDNRQTAQFSLEELGLTEEDVTPAQQEAHTQPTGAGSDQDDLLTPFSLADLGLSEDEIAQIQQDDEAIPQEKSATGLGDDDTTLTPFSLADLGLTEDEIAEIQRDEQEPATGELMDAPSAVEEENRPQQAVDTEEVQSVSGTDTSSDTAASSSATDEDELELEPFSLSDLGLSDDEIQQLQTQEQPAADAETTIDDVEPFSLDDWGLDETGSVTNSSGGNENYELPDELRPFSLDDLDITASGGQRGFDIGALPPSLQPFSLDEFSDIPQTESSSQSSLPVDMSSDDESASQTGGYSFREAPAKANTDFVRDQQEPEESGRPSIFAKLRQRHSELPQEELPPLAPVADHEMDMTLFGNDDVPLRDDVAVEQPAENEATTPSSVESPAVPGDEPDLTPFSLSDLGLSPEEIAALGLEETISETELSEAQGQQNETQQAETPVQQEVSSTEEAVPSSSDEPDLTPFSLSDLGLSPEEIASLGLEETTGQVTTDEAQTVQQEVSQQDSQETTPVEESLPALNDESDLTPFSLSDLGLSPEEIASLGLEETTDQAPAGRAASDEEEILFDFDSLGEQPTALTPRGQEEGFDESLRPFSLDDLGLDDNETLTFEGATGNELGLTEEELAGMDFGGFEQPVPPIPQQNGEEQYQVDTGDAVLDELITIGRRQGFVDLDDIIRAVENPEEEAERIEEIGQVLHRAGIQIRDGDEIIDMEEEDDDVYTVYADEEPEEEPQAENPVVTSSEEPELTPFSLSDLGLTPEEIASLGLEETPSDEPDLSAPNPAEGAIETAPSETASDEPDLTPFSLSDLGLSPEEIAALGLEETTSGSEAGIPSEGALDAASVSIEEAASDTTSNDEPDLTPFSLSDLGLSPEEIAALGIEEGAVSTESTPQEDTALNDLDDTFDFSVAEAARNEVVAAPSEPRVREEEPPPPVLPEDAAFEATPLENLDSIWDAVPAEPTSFFTPPTPEPPARTPEPPTPPLDRQAAPPLPPVNERIVRIEKTPQPSQAREPERREPERREPERREPPAPPSERKEAQPTTSTTRTTRSGPRQLRQSPTSFIPTGDSTLDDYLRQLEAEPENTPLQLAVARISGQTERIDLSVQQYKALIKSGSALDQVTEDLQELIEDTQDHGTLQRLYRLLGDAYTKQNRFRDAVEAYSWTFTK